MKIKVLFAVGIYLLLSGCQKRKYPEEKIQLENEDIYFTGYFGADPVDLKTGTDGYYCYSSYRQRSDNVYVFEGTLRKFNCDPCPLSFHIELSDYRQRLTGSPVPVDSVLRTGTRNFLPGLPEANILKFVSHSNKEISSRRWQLSNGVTSEDSVINCEFSQPGVQTVSLTILTKGNCESVVVNRVFVGGTNGFFAGSFTSTPLQNNSSQFSASIIGGVPPYRYVWNFGDGEISDLSAPIHNYKWAGAYPVKLRITDAENHVCESNYIHIAGNDYSSCAANMSLSYAGKKNVSLNRVKIQWTDQTNVLFSSDSITQTRDSYFEILKSQNYVPNERGESGQLLTLRFNALLSNGNRKVWLRSENATIAVTYK